MNFAGAKVVGGVLMLAGTSIGAGMLALPVTSGPAGYTNSVLLFCLACAFMGYTVFLLLEALLSARQKHSNLVSLVGEYFGVKGQVVAWLCCLLLLYAVSAAYLTAGGAILYAVSQHLPVARLPNEVSGMLVFMGLLGAVAFMRARWVDYLNRVLMLALIISFLCLVYGTGSEMQAYRFDSGSRLYLLAAAPVIFLSFTSHPVFPSVCEYFGYRVKTLRLVILSGYALPLLFYVVWQTIVVGALPLQGKEGLIALSQSEYPVTAMTGALEHRFSRPWLSSAVTGFSFFAMATSYLAVKLSLVEFIEDGLGSRPMAKPMAVLATLVPPLVFALLYPAGFIFALGYAGVFVAVLYCILPALMVWKARYQIGAAGWHSQVKFKAPGGRFVLVLVLLMSLAVIGFQLAATFNLLPVPA